MTPDELVHACRVPTAVPEGRAGLWEVRRFSLPRMSSTVGVAIARHLGGLGPYDGYTALLRDTVATLHRDFGEVVMEDTPRELRRHLPILLAARGRVLISGLGLGCVLRGLLAKPDVEHVDVVEIDPHIITLVGAEFEGNPRVTIHLGDAESIEWPIGMRWDFAWHDVWSDREALDLVHARMLVRYRDLCGAQGAWEFKRSVKRIWPRALLNGCRMQRARAGV